LGSITSHMAALGKMTESVPRLLLLPFQDVYQGIYQHCNL